MSLERLVERIMSDARDYADGLINSARLRRLDLLKQADADAEEQYREILEEARRSAEEEKQQRITNAVLQARREILEEKQKLIQSALDRAVETILSLPREEYIRMLAGQMSEVGRDLEGELILSQPDRESIGEELADSVNRMIGESGGTGRVSLSRETRDISGGFILKTEGMELNHSLDAEIESHREEIVEEVTKILFPDRTGTGRALEERAER